MFDVSTFNQIPDDGEIDHQQQQQNLNQSQLNQSQIVEHKPTLLVPIVQYDNPTSIGLVTFINNLIDNRPFKPNFYIIR